MLIMFMKRFGDGVETNFREKILNGVKKHTMRESFRVRKGMKLDLANWSDKAYRSPVDRFVVGVECVSTQRVNISHKNGVPMIYVDGRLLDTEETGEFSVNDGFADENDFFKHFNKDGTYNLIHWTDKKY